MLQHARVRVTEVRRARKKQQRQQQQQNNNYRLQRFPLIASFSHRIRYTVPTKQKKRKQRNAYKITSAKKFKLPAQKQVDDW